MRWYRICGLTLLFFFLTPHPIHAYERDVHYDLTRYLARWADFSEDEAEQVAAADQEIDGKPEFNPLPNPNFCPELRKIAGPASAIVAIPVACKNDPEFQRMVTAQRAYHFADSERLQALRDSAFQGRNLKTLGHYLHALQDTFAHSLMDYTDLPPLDKLVANLGRLPDEKVIGHFLYGHSLDKTYERPDLAEQMARHVYAELMRFKGSANRWNDIDAAVARFVREQDSQKKLAHLSASTLQGPAPTTSQPPSLQPDKPQEPMHEGRTFAEWQADLRDASSKVREKAAKALGHFGLEAVPILAQTLKDTNADVRWAAAHALGEIGPAAKNAVPALVQALEDIDGVVRARAKTTLRRIDPAAFEEWERAGKTGAEARDAIPALTEASKKGNLAARYALRRIKFPSSPPDSCRDELGERLGDVLASERARPCPVEGDEEKKAAADKLNVAFTRKHGIRESVACGALSRNPFAYEGKVIALNVSFQQMIARDRGLFGCGVAVSGIPHGVFSSREVEVVLAGRGLGNTEVKIGPATLQVPHLQYVGVHICKERDCADFFGPASMR